MLTVRPGEARGATRLSWLRSQHSFSFGSYYDPEHMGVSALRVINDDRVKPGSGFATHSHRDMEIISYVKKGVIEHKDSMGNIKSLPAGEVQLMTAGIGVTHSEYNPSEFEPLEFLQIWIQPNQLGIEPGYQQKAFVRQQGLSLIASPDARSDSLQIHQDACLYRLILQDGDTEALGLDEGRTGYVQVVKGELKVNGVPLHTGDGAAITRITELVFSGLSSAEALVFDLP
jgi:redox-sensitive bicupin YhaK (pirin superfamily)